jgi:flagella basal body P-ring formation protein FlgA
MKTPKLSLCLMLVASQIGAAATNQSLPAIQDAVINYVQSSLEEGGEYQITHSQLDPRLQLAACEQSLEVFVQSGVIRPGRNTVGIRCNGASSWTIYNTVLVKSFIKVLVSTQSLNRNDKINPESIVIETRDVSTLQPGYINDPGFLIDKVATRPVPAGSVIYNAYIAEPRLVKRGERVNIQSGSPGLMITSEGVAMMDGAKGQKISVKNISSNRVIQGTVMYPGLVAVNF